MGPQGIVRVRTAARDPGSTPPTTQLPPRAYRHCTYIYQTFINFNFRSDVINGNEIVHTHQNNSPKNFLQLQSIDAHIHRIHKLLGPFNHNKSNHK